MKNRGKAVVFESMEDYHQQIDDPELDIDKNPVIVLKGVRPKGIRGCLRWEMSICLKNF
jgi:dihydroxy-acid dehydratase